MSIRRIYILLEREIVRGPKNFLFIFALVVPVVISLMVNLVFGSFFSGKPKLGMADPGGSQFAELAREVDSIEFKEYASESELKRAVARGALDFGLTLPDGFDEDLSQQERTRLLVYTWGESELKDRAILSATIVGLLRQIIGQQAPVEIVTETLGDGENIPWEDRLLPFIVMMAVLLGGLMVPATSIVEEKQKRTIKALTTTPTSLGDVLVAKGVLGALLSATMGLLILLINRGLGTQPLLLLTLLLLGAVMAAQIGVLLGVWFKDVDTLFATIKGMGIILYAPALVYMFPEIPQWIGRIFPTYYMIGPIIEISQRGAAPDDIVVDVAVLIGFIVLLMVAVSVVGRRMQLQEA